jgi:hypothetical protein
VGWAGGVPAQLQESALELILGWRWLWVVVGDDRAQHRRAAAARGSGKYVVDCGQIEQAQDLGLLDSALLAAPVDDIGEVEEGSRDGGAGDVRDLGRVLGAQGSSPMDVDTRYRAPSRTAQGHVDP